MAQVPPSVINAAQRVVGPAAVVGRICRVLSLGALGAALVVGLTLGLGAVGRTGSGVAVSVIAVLLLAVPGWWLRQAANALAGVAALPEWLASATKVPKIPVRNKADLEQLRDGGVIGAVRTIRSTVGEVSDYLAPAASITAVASPPFWAWTGIAATTAMLLAFAAVICGLGWMLWLAF